MKTVFISLVYVLTFCGFSLASNSKNTYDSTNSLLEENLRLEIKYKKMMIEYIEMQQKRQLKEDSKPWLAIPENQQLLSCFFSALALIVSISAIYYQGRAVKKELDYIREERISYHFDKIENLTTHWNNLESSRDYFAKKFKGIGHYKNHTLSIKEIDKIDIEEKAKGNLLLSTRIKSFLNVLELMSMAIDTKNVNSDYVNKNFRNVIIYYSVLFGNYIKFLDKNIDANKNLGEQSYPYIMKIWETENIKL